VEMEGVIALTPVNACVQYRLEMLLKEISSILRRNQRNK
jgi:hypothetical protein